MVQRCIVLNCESKWYSGCSLIFHSFPKDVQRRNLWLSAIKIKNQFYESAKICNKHFSNCDYVSGNRLKVTACPIFPNLPELIEQHLNEPVPSTSNIVFQDSHSMIFQKPSSVLQPILNTNIIDESPPPRKRKRKGLQDVLEQKSGDENTPVTSQDKSVQANLKTNRVQFLQKQRKLLAQKVARQNKSINNLKSLISIVRDYTKHSEIENIINGRFSHICAQFKTAIKHPHAMRYSEEVKSFALTLHFYSPKAYKFLKKYVSLPSVETLRRSLVSFDCNVGFISEVMEFLSSEIKKPEKFFLKNVALIFDSMALKKDLSRDLKTGKIFGYVDLGQITVSDSEELACEALVLQIVSYGNYFKCPIAYFYTQNSLSGELLAEIVLTAINLLDEIGITVRSLTCDGAASNLKCYTHLGCSLNINDWRPFFKHPNNVSNVYCMLDAAHMLKLARNVLASQAITTNEGDTSFSYIQKLHQIQSQEGLKFANSLSASHIDFKNKKMNVRLAAQVISSSVADALDFLKCSGNLDFKGSEPTIIFLRLLDRLFDLMNSKSPFGTGYKSPLSLQNKIYWERIFKDTKTYLLSLKINGVSILNHNRKTFALGFLMNITCLTSLVTDMCTLKSSENPLKYLLTFKCSQDNLEIFFSCIRARGRAQDNPSPLEFRYIMRKLLFRNSIQPSYNSNCVDDSFQTTHILNFNKKHKDLVEPPPTTSKSLDGEFDIIIDKIKSLETTSYQENILFYITGFIVKKILNNLVCQYCQNLLLSENNTKNDHTYHALDINKYQSFTSFINRGKLHFPSASAFTVVKFADKVFRHTISLNKLKINLVEMKMINIVNQHFAPILERMFNHPTPESITCSDLHESILVKKLSSLFFKIRIKAFLKTHIETSLADLRGKRQIHHKTVLFSHL